MTINMNEKKQISPKDKRGIQYIPFALTIFVGVMLSVVAFTVVRNWEDHDVQYHFERHAEEHISALKSYIRSNLLIIELLAGLYKASHNVERQEFREFVKPFLSRYPGIQALEWIPRVPDSERAVYEEGARKDGFPDFQITERQAQGDMVRAAQREEYFPVYFVEPYEGNEVALGFDLASNPTRLEALNRSRKTGEMVATARITLVQETGSQFGFLVFLPVYRKGSPMDSIEDRRENLKGFVLGVFRVGDILETALTNLQPEAVDIYLYDESAPADGRFLYLHSAPTRKRSAAPRGAEEVDLRAGLHHATALDLAGRKWSVLCVPRSEFIAASSTWQPWGVLSFGLLITGLLAAYFLLNIGRTARIEGLVIKRTDELLKANEGLGREIILRKKAEKELNKHQMYLEELVKRRAHDLGERVKELKCLYGISGLVEKPGISMEDIFRGTIDLIPSSWQYPEITCARIILKGQEYKTEKFRETIWKQASDILGHGERIGAVEVFYLEEKPESDEGPFLKEERHLIKAIASDLGRIVKRKWAEEALRESENKYRILLENLPQKIFHKDKDSVYASCNENYARDLKIKPEDINGRTDYEFFPEELAEKYRADDKRIIASGETEDIEEKYIQDGQERWVHTVKTPIKDEKGNIAGVLGLFWDISDSKRIEEEKKKLETQILQSEKMASIGQLAAGVAHEINNPTGFVSSNLKTLSDYQNDVFSLIAEYRKLIADLKETMATAEYPGSIPEQMERIVALESKVDIDYILDDSPNLIKESREGTERIKKIVIDLKDFAHPGEQELKYANINKNFDSTLNIVWNELKYKTTVTKDYGELPEVRCYPQQLNQVFMNLLLNAAQAIEKEGKIRIATRAVDDQVEIAISDTGVGIPKENLSKLFDPFFTTKDVGKGTGLGLNVAYNIIKKHKGTIKVESTVGKGTTFRVRIPVG